jgi:cysteine synthase A
MHKTDNILSLIGNTSLIKLEGISHNCEIRAKCEFLNPFGSIKDRVALNIIKTGIHNGSINQNSLIIEATSGNTGIALAGIGKALGLRVAIVMPESMSRERRAIIKQLGAELILTPAHLGMAGAVAKANEIALLETKAFLSDQFNNPANPEIHFKTTGKEIWEQTVGKIDIFVVGVGTGGTISGVGKYLKSKNPKIQIIAVEPLESAILSGGNPSPHKIQGIGSGFVPQNLDPSVIDEVIQISGDDAIRESRELGKTNGILVGISSGANILASKIVANRFENMNKKIVTILNDSGERYISTELFNY